MVCDGTAYQLAHLASAISHEESRSLHSTYRGVCKQDGGPPGPRASPGGSSKVSSTTMLDDHRLIPEPGCRAPKLHVETPNDPFEDLSSAISPIVSSQEKTIGHRPLARQLRAYSELY